MDDLSEHLCDIQGLFARDWALFVRIRVRFRAIEVRDRAKKIAHRFARFRATIVRSYRA